MRGVKGISTFICARCLRYRSTASNGQALISARNASSSAKAAEDGAVDQPSHGEEKGAMSRRLAQMSEESIETGGRSAQKAVEEAGFSDDLKRQLEEKIANASFKSDNAQAIAHSNLPFGVGKEIRDTASARPWTGTETTEDATLRMLTDAHKPLRTTPRVPGIRGPPSKIDTGRPSRKAHAGTRIANARDRTSMYEYAKDAGLSEQEREKFRQELKQRFSPAGRSGPASVAGLASLANQRIDDAIARVKFKNLPRGQKIEKDHNANSPFIDTTEYFMNKIIQRQDIVPPWIEKQQELVSTATKFRSRLRADWKRHVARVISSRGGDLQHQMRLAEEYAAAEIIHNSIKKKTETLNAVDDGGHVSQISLSGDLKVTKPESDMSIQEQESHIENEIKIMEQTFNDDGTLRSQPDTTITIRTEDSEQPPDTAQQSPAQVHVQPFRDPTWEKTEHGYLNAAVNNLNNLARTYNLMAPPIARKPYYYLDRELKACYADVAPLIAGAIKERALAPRIKGIEIVGHRPGGVLDKFSMDQKAKVYDDQRPEYGFKQFWKDLFTSGSKG